uniref:Acyl-CoA thioesterase II n=1 Tax=Globodera pallida TaxID=36090 RepID=A0A183BNP9_GLOPA
MPTFSEFAVHAVRRMSTDDSAGGGQKPLKLDLDYLKRLAQLERIDADCFRANFLVPGYRKALNKDVYGGLMFAQAVAAAEATADGQFAPHAAHSLFTSKAFTDRPIEYSVTKTRDGRSFCTRKVEARQDGRIVLSAQISLCVKEPSAIEHQEAMPEVPSPETVAPFFDTARDVVNQHDEGRTTQNATIIANLRTLLDDENQLSIFEFRPVHPDIFIGFRRHSPTPILYWLKCLVPLGAERTNKALNRFLLAFITDATMASTANRPHTSHGHQPSMVVTLDHVVHFHSDDFSVDEWLLCENSSPIADGGRALTDGRIWDRNGRLLLTARQESLIRSRAKETSKL